MYMLCVICLSYVLMLMVIECFLFSDVVDSFSDIVIIMDNVSVSPNDDNVNLVCKTCDDFVNTFLNGCKSECGLLKCCICKAEAINHSITKGTEVTNNDVNNA